MVNRDGESDVTGRRASFISLHIPDPQPLGLLSPQQGITANPGQVPEERGQVRAHPVSADTSEV